MSDWSSTKEKRGQARIALIYAACIAETIGCDAIERASEKPLRTRQKPGNTPENAASTFMMPDPTIDAIREVRHRISASVGHDARKSVEHYRQLQQRHSERLVSRGTEKLQPLEKHVA